MTTDDIMGLADVYATAVPNQRDTEACRQALREAINKLMADNETLLRQAVAMLETMPVKHPDQIEPRNELCAKLRARLQ